MSNSDRYAGPKKKGWNWIDNSISLADCKRIAQEVLKCGEDINAMPLSVAIVDNGGNLKYFEKQDGSGIMRYQISFGKAYSALTMGFSTRSMCENLGARVGFVSSLNSASGKTMFAPGGILIMKNSKVVGAVGVSGDTSLRDEYCAINGAKICGFETSPAQPSPQVTKSKL